MGNEWSVIDMRDHKSSSPPQLRDKTNANVEHEALAETEQKSLSQAQIREKINETSERETPVDTEHKSSQLGEKITDNSEQETPVDPENKSSPQPQLREKNNDNSEQETAAETELKSSQLEEKTNDNCEQETHADPQNQNSSQPHLPEKINESNEQEKRADTEIKSSSQPQPRQKTNDNSEQKKPSDTQTSKPNKSIPFSLVWVTQGKTQHAAFLLESDSNSDNVKIRWAANDAIAWVERHQVDIALRPRRRGAKEDSSSNIERKQRRKRDRSNSTEYETTDSEESVPATVSSRTSRRRRQPALVTSSYETNYNVQKSVETISRHSARKKVRHSQGVTTKEEVTRYAASNANTGKLAKKKKDVEESVQSVVAVNEDDDVHSDDDFLDDDDDDYYTEDGDDDSELDLVLTDLAVKQQQQAEKKKRNRVSLSPNTDHNARATTSSVKKARKNSISNQQQKQPPTTPQRKIHHNTSERVVITIDDSPLLSKTHRDASNKSCGVPFDLGEDCRKTKPCPATNIGSMKSSSTTSSTERCSTDSSINSFHPVLSTTAASCTLRNVSETGVSEDGLASANSLSKNNNAPEYTLQSSAYVQNLAEICYTIQNDARWRVSNPKQQRLFDWSLGDDLSVVVALGRQYREVRKVDENVMVPETQQCSCLLCRGNQTKKDKTTTYERKTDTPKQSKQKAVCPSPNTISLPGDETKSNTSGVNDDFEMTEEEMRSLYLYCRLFYRKGPWFRIDDIYQKYYAPKRKVNNPLDDPSDTHRNTSSAEEVATAVNDTFFLPNKSKNAFRAAPQNIGKLKQSCIDQTLLKEHLERVVDLLKDVKKLLAAGWMRSFDGEAECGKTVGVTLLSAEEKRYVISKLGGAKTKKPPKNSTNFHSCPENEIWKQMSRQQSIFFNTKNGDKVKLLPVKRHVNQIMMDKLAKTIIQACSNSDYVPMSVLQTQTDAIKTSILERLAAEELSDNISDANTVLPDMCLKLREKPTMTLRRYSRLYLCATAGPGDMRSDGLNGWRSLLDHSKSSPTPLNPPLAKAIPPPCEQTWHLVQYPGLAQRFGLRSSFFRNAYRFVPADENRRLNSCQVFSSVKSFHAWEHCIELRANVDYLIELNEMLRYNQRRVDKGRDPLYQNKANQCGEDSVDLMALQTEAGLSLLLDKILPALGECPFTETRLQIESEIQRSLQAFEGECEKVLCIIGCVCTHILSLCNKAILSEEIQIITDRPWLRHLFWPGCLAYILWDIIPIFERRQQHGLAIQALELLLFGNFKDQSSKQDPSDISFPKPSDTTILAPFLLSRRAKGKAFDRLIIDYTHLHRRSFAKAKDKSVKRKASEALQGKIVEFCEVIVNELSPKSSIGFSAIRNVAKRLKRPLSTTLNKLYCLEGIELGLRYGSNEDDAAAVNKYSDWNPITDRTIANALDGDENGAGARCAYVGFEDDENNGVAIRSLNVEQLAMEFYRSGRLPADDDNNGISHKGGWNGWHDEGGHVRALFRIISSGPLLGMDWGCSFADPSNGEIEENLTIHLTPHQVAPFDLHVGFELREDKFSKTKQTIPTRGFYFRRQDRIKDFLDKLSKLSDQEVCDLVHDSILTRLQYMHANRQKDPFIERDVIQSRTLSLIAAGCGGPSLAAIFRCLFFDYRHYSGGLPDLLLARALYIDSETDDDKGNNSNPVVDLGAWVGEMFSPEYQSAMAAELGEHIICDRDDEFLGCNKVGDSGGRSTNRGNSGRQMKPLLPDATKKTAIPSLSLLGERLVLEHNGRRIKAECMMVEVKSSNDRLDSRQEDWLNILDKHGNARVCKFEKGGKLSNG